MKYTIPLILKQSQTTPLKYLFFWGHQPGKNGQITASCFSQWFESPFTVDGQTYATAEHWMMAGKARLFNDEEILSQIMASTNPGKAKALGRKVRGFQPEEWDAAKFDIVVEGNLHKFRQIPEMGEFLKNTQSRILVEASPVDFIWGIGMAKDHPKVNDPAAWKGQNLLGFALMEVRDKL